mgnify:CR=1 FL=1
MEVTKASAWIEALTVSKADFLAGKYSKIYSWDDIPAHWFLWADQAGLLTWEKGEKLKRATAAKIEAESEATTPFGIAARAVIIQRKRKIWDQLVNKSKI